MSGIFGICDPSMKTDVKPMVGEMFSAMCHRSWYCAEFEMGHPAGLAIGRIGVGIFNKTRQPVWNSSRTAALVWSGEIYNLPARVFPGQTEEQILLDLYNLEGINFASRLNGAFVLAIWDRTKDLLLIGTDRFGFYSLYYSTQGNRLVFAPEIKGVLCDRRISRQLDLAAQAQYMRFQQVLGDRTFFETIKRLPGATLLLFDTTSGAHSLQKYWSYHAIGLRSGISFQEAVDETGRLLSRAVERLSEDEYRPGVLLSGGLDSRTILGLTKRSDVNTFTYGAANSRDVYYASRIAKSEQSRHTWLNFVNGNWVLENLGFHFTLTEGFHSWIHAHGINLLPMMRERIDVNLTGWDGGTVMGHPALVESKPTTSDDFALTVRQYHLLTRVHTWPSLTESEESLLYTPPALKMVQGLAFDSMRAELKCYLDYRKDVRGEFFFIDNHCMRLTHNMVVFGRSHVEYRFPYFDQDFFDFIYSLPASFRSGRRLYYSLIQRKTPRLAMIPYDKDEFLPTERKIVRLLQALTLRTKRRVNRHVYEVFPEKKSLYADYEKYLRHELRSWAEQILFSKRLEDRGIFNPAAIKSLMKRHISGREEWTIGKIAPIMTYEMVLREFCD
jgi:asparagine synthase (glutamine-hydrolysing)